MNSRDSGARTAMPDIRQVRRLPLLLTMTIPEQWQDLNGHVNVQYYLRLYDLSGEPLMKLLDIDASQIEVERIGYFDLEHHLWFLAEMHVGDRVSTYFRFLSQGDKRFHGLMFVVNDTRSALAAVLEFVTTGAHLDSRRSALLPLGVAASLSEIITQHSRLEWAAPSCGAMAP